MPDDPVLDYTAAVLIAVLLGIALAVTVDYLIDRRANRRRLAAVAIVRSTIPPPAPTAGHTGYPAPLPPPLPEVLMYDPHLATPQPQPSLYERLTNYGTNVEVFETVTEMQLNRILGPADSDPVLHGDPLLLPYFRKPSGEFVARPRLARHVTAFLMQATGGPKQYNGRAMELAHAPGHPGQAPTMPITDAAFDRFVDHLADVLTDLQVPQEWIDEIAGEVAPLRPAIVQHAGV